MYVLTDKGLKYLDRKMGSAIRGGAESERKERILSEIEYLGGLATFGQIWEGNHTIQRMGYMEHPKELEHYIGQSGTWSAPGTEADFTRTVERLVQEGYLAEESN